MRVCTSVPNVDSAVPAAVNVSADALASADSTLLVSAA